MPPPPRRPSAAPDRVVGVAGDLADPEVADRLVATAMERFGRLDGTVVSVGGPPPGPAATMEDDTWRTAFESVFLGPLRLARAVLASGDGQAVTFVLSSSVRSPIPGLAISNGLRPGLAMAAKTLADEYGAAGVARQRRAPRPDRHRPRPRARRGRW